MEPCKENLRSFLKLKENQQTFLRHGRPKLSHVQGHRESRINLIFFAANRVHVGVRGHGCGQQL